MFKDPKNQVYFRLILAAVRDLPRHSVLEEDPREELPVLREFDFSEDGFLDLGEAEIKSIMNFVQHKLDAE